MDERTKLTVQQPIELLDKVEDKTKPVLCEGCDCVGDAMGISEDHNSVTIVR